MPKMQVEEKYMNDSNERKEDREKFWGPDNTMVTGGRWWDYTTYNNISYVPPIAYAYKNTDKETKTP